VRNADCRGGGSREGKRPLQSGFPRRERVIPDRRKRAETVDAMAGTAKRSLRLKAGTKRAEEAEGFVPGMRSGCAVSCSGRPRRLNFQTERRAEGLLTPFYKFVFVL
jgi:hypothetical protein